MYNCKLTSYVPEPNPATTKCIVAAFNDIHDYPECMPLLEYYDGENKAVCDWEIKWAVEHGINCFIHCWYRKLENMGKPVAVKDFHCGKGLHEALFNAKYQKYMKFAIMFDNSPQWGTTDSKDAIEHLMPFWIENYFSRENYLKIDNKPVLFIFYQNRLAEVFPNPHEQKMMFDSCRGYAVKHGFDGMIFGLCDAHIAQDGYKESIARGYDFRFGYCPKKNCPEEEEVIKGQVEHFKAYQQIDPMRHLATAAYKSWHLSPENYRRVLKEMKKIIDAMPEGAWGRRIFVIDNWNEWDKGHFVSPSHEFGFKYLQAIREELTECDNLPDYFSGISCVIANISKIICDKKKVVQNQSASKIMSYVSQNYCNSGLSLKQISFELGFNEHYVSDLFKNAYGENLSVYLERLRIEKACEMMSDDNVKIREVSRKVGYTSNSSFRRAFKKVTGILPSEYKSI